MSKQNRTSPKYILIAPSSPDPARPRPPLKKRTQAGKRYPEIDRTTPTPWQTSKALLKQENARSFSRETTKGMESIRGELAECMAAVQEESRRNAVLRELIGVVGTEMQRAAQVEKRVQEVEVEECLKRAQKVDYDIEQILQKHNEEVAKINTLKEQVASARSDRVVFSNLFRKLEKEIKRSEEYYRSLTITTEINRQRKAQRELKQQELSQQISVDEIEPRDEQARPSAIKTANKQNTRQDCKFFLTIPDKSTTANPNKKASYRIPQQGECSSKRLKYMIESVETKIEKLAKTGECGNWAEAIEFYGSVEEENGRLADLVLQEQRKIEAVQAEIERIRLERRISEVYESRQLGKLENLASTRKIRSIKHIRTTLTEQSEKCDENADILASVFDVLALPRPRVAEKLAGSEQAMVALWERLDKLCSGKAFKKSESSLSNSSAEHDLDNLLGKMDKFEASDRILTRNQFYTEYVKEVSRNKRLLKRK